jgi:hypothetical protein
MPSLFSCNIFLLVILLVILYHPLLKVAVFLTVSFRKPRSFSVCTEVLPVTPSISVSILEDIRRAMSRCAQSDSYWSQVFQSILKCDFGHS